MPMSKSALERARELIKKAQDVAISMNCSWIRGIVHLKTINATESLKALLYYGCKAIGSSNNMVFVEMNVKEKIIIPYYIMESCKDDCNCQKCYSKRYYIKNKRLLVG